MRIMIKSNQEIKVKLKAKVLIEFNGNLLLLRPTNKSKLTLIGGTVNSSETPVQAIIREAYEEAGIVLTPDDLKTFVSGKTMINNKPTLLYCFLVRHKNMMFELKEKHKFELIGWAPIRNGLKKLRGAEKELSNELVQRYIMNAVDHYRLRSI